MKNYLVKATMMFNDMEEKTEAGTDIPRKIGDVFNCTKERYEYLKAHNAVMLVGIEKVKEEKEEAEAAIEYSEEEVKPKAASKKKKKTSKK